MDGAATLKQVDITVTAAGKSLTIHLTLFIPTQVPKPVPIFLLICNRASRTSIPRARRRASSGPPRRLSQGYGIAAFHNADVDPDNHDGFRDGIHGILDGGKREPDAWGTIAAWAWGPAAAWTTSRPTPSRATRSR